MTQNGSPVTRRQALAVGVGATIGSFMLPRGWFLSPPERTPQITTGAWPMERHDPARTGHTPVANGLTGTPNVSWQATITDNDGKRANSEPFPGPKARSAGPNPRFESETVPRSATSSYSSGLATT
ncbi:hypothetical protein [Halocatena salina]|uniref:Uncharacterized protein n=1 Tax=Halocatena salina TaxID=2934340 RepID=A0A8U0AA54_9EURY|nr:hypothetical protein [Halocatena salina]UPM44833.1 hypothetical protein MW046_15700 [Halocatena salina]